MAVAGGLLLSWGTPAAADVVRGTRSEKLVETAHRIAVTLHPGHAELVVRRTVHNGGPRHDQAVFWIDLPEGAVATGLRTLGMLDGRPHWFAGELMEAGQAADRYRELTGISGYRWVKDPALLSWSSQRALALQLFPVAPRAPKTVEYTLTMPTVYRDGRHHLSLPALGTERKLAIVRARPAPGAGRIFVDGSPGGSLAKVELAADHEADVSLAPRRAPELGGALAVVPFAPQRVLTRVRVEAAPKLSRVPQGARVVVVIDVSRSLSEERVKAQIAAARAYLSHLVPADGRVAVLTVARRVRALHSGFVPAQRALADLASLGTERFNGSNVDRGLVEAERRLASVPASSPKRILLLTDTRTRTSLTESGIRGSIGTSGAILHVGVIGVGAPTLDCDDEHPWSPAVRSTGGLLWSGYAEPDSASALDAAHRDTFEEWARPVRVHRFRVSAAGAADGRLVFDETLDEGQGVAAGWIGSVELPWLRVEGELWAEPMVRIIRPDAAEAKRWAALVFGSEMFYSLSEAEMMSLAMRGGAVSPVTSYLAVEPGVRPSTEGLDHDGSGRGEGIGLGSIGTIGHGAGTGLGGFDHAAFLRRKLASAWQRCGGSGRGATVKLETTLAEIVDVTRVEIDGSSAPKLATCLREATWQLVLPSRFRSVPAETWSIRV